MFKRFMSLFTLEKRIASELQAQLNGARALISQQQLLAERNISAYAGKIDHMRADMNERLSKIEVCFAEEIKAKEALTLQKIKEARAKALG